MRSVRAARMREAGVLAAAVEGRSRNDPTTAPHPLPERQAPFRREGARPAPAAVTRSCAPPLCPVAAATAPAQCVGLPVGAVPPCALRARRRVWPWPRAPRSPSDSLPRRG